MDYLIDNEDLAMSIEARCPCQGACFGCTGCQFGCTGGCANICTGCARLSGGI